MSGKIQEDEIILALLERGDPFAAELDAEEDAEAETLRRLYLEVLGLLPLAIAPVEPRIELKERLLASLVADAPPRTPTAPLAPLLSFRPVEPEPASPPARVEAATVEPEPRAPASRPSTWRRFWPVGLAAGVALVTISGLILSFRQDLDGADRQLTELRTRLADSMAKERSFAERIASLERDSSVQVERLSVITGVGSTACPLRPEADGPALARGVLYVAADHQHWFLKVAGLPPPGFGRTYQLWFLTESGAVSGGKFETSTAATAELGSPTMPTGIRGFAITLEPKAGGSQPTGPRILAGDEVMPLL